MKKLITFLIGILIAVSLQAQTENSFKYVLKTKGGLINTLKGLAADKLDSVKVSAGAFKVYQGATQLNPDVPAAFQVDGSTVYPLLVDTVPLVTFGLGSGATADTACFNNSRLAGSFYNGGSDTLAITQLVGILKEGTGTETIDVQISWHATFLSGSATSLNAAALSITSLTTGTIDASFANSKIPPGVFVWCVLSGASADNKPTFLNVTLSGYKIPTY
jgi:hypothetical protein